MPTPDQQKRPVEWSHPRDWGVLLLYVLVVVGLQLAGGAFNGERVSYGDESPQYLNSVVIRDYVAGGIGQSPISFAVRYYAAYPKIALFVWPPLFHVVLASFMLLAGNGVAKALVVIGVCCAGCAWTLYLCLRRRGHTALSSATAGLLLVLLPFSQHMNSVVMLESPLMLLTFVVAWQAAAFTDDPSRANAIGLGLLCGMACLTKANALAAIAAIPLTLLLANRLGLLRRREIYLAGLIMVLLSAVPFVVAARFRSNNALIASLTPALVGHAIRHYLPRVFDMLGWVLSFAIFGGLCVALLRVARDPDRSRHRTLRISMFSSALMVFVFYAFAPNTDFEERYLYPAFACLFFFLPELGRWLREKSGRTWSEAPVCAVLVAAFLGSEFRVVKTTPAGFRDAVRVAREDAGDRPLRLFVSSNDRGEGALIVETEESDPSRRDTVIRASKLLMLSSWQGERMEILPLAPAQVAERLERLGVRYVIMDRTERMTDHIYQTMDRMLSLGEDRFRLVADLKPGPRRVRNIQIYRVVRASDPPAERFELRLPFAVNIVGNRIIRQ